MITLGQPERRLETIFGFYQFWPVLTGFDRFWPVLRQCYSKLQSRCVKLSVMLSLADSKIVSSFSLNCHLLHLGTVPHTPRHKECSSAKAASHNLSAAMNSPTANLNHLDCVWQHQLSVPLKASHLTLNLVIWIINLLEWHFSVSEPLLVVAQFQEEITWALLGRIHALSRRSDSTHCVILTA